MKDISVSDEFCMQDSRRAACLASEERSYIEDQYTDAGNVYDHSSSYSKNDGSATFESDVYVLNIDD